MIGAVLLAAGSSQRFGSDKLLASLPDGRPIAVAAASTLVATVAKVIAVVRPGAEALHDALRRCGTEVIVCPNASAGMGASLAWAVAMTSDWDGWIVALADMPLVNRETVRAVAKAVAAGADLAAPGFQGRRGHPVGFGRSYRDALLALHADRGARDLVAAAGKRLRLIDCDDPGVLADIDAPSDLERLAGAPGTRDLR